MLPGHWRKVFGKDKWSELTQEQKDRILAYEADNEAMGKAFGSLAKFSCQCSPDIERPFSEHKQHFVCRYGE